MSRTPEEDTREQALDLMKSFIGLLDERWITSARFIEIAKEHAQDSTQARIVLITGIKTLLRNLPVEVFPDPEARDRLLRAVQEALDLTVDEEDAKA